MFKRYTLILLVIILLSALVWVGQGRSVRAAGVVVDTLVDKNDHSCSDGDCSLREAVEVAGSGDTITFDYSLSNGTIILDSEITIDKNLTIDGGSLGGHLEISGGNTGTDGVRIFWINSGSSLSLIHLDLVDGYTGTTNGAGAIINSASSTLTISNCLFSGHLADLKGGVIVNHGDLNISDSVFEDNESYIGGVIYNDETMEVSGSTFSGNTGYDGSVVFDSGTSVIYNSTFYDNTVSGSFTTGAYVAEGPSTTIINCTFSENNAVASPAAGLVKHVSSGNSLSLKNTILANSNASYDCYVTGGLASDVNNIIENHSGCGTPVFNGDPVLDELRNNGGPSWAVELLTVALGPGSPAIDAGDPATCADAGTVNNFDQRGITRPIDADLDGTPECDIGAYEAQVRYVETSGSDSGNYCENSGSPCATITNAVNSSKSGDVISIGPGTFAEGSHLNVGIYLDIVGAGMDQTFLDGGDAHRVMWISNPVVRISDLTIQNGNAPDSLGGGAIVNGGTLTLERVSIDNNTTTGTGGGIVSYDTLVIRDSIISNNETTGGSRSGGGLFVSGGGSSANITNTTISGNNATQSGGGLHFQGTGALDLTNVTISGNTSFAGGGMTNTNTGTATLLNCTITNNHLLEAGYAGGIANYATLEIKNSIVAGNDERQCIPSGTWTSQGYNLSSDDECDFTQTGDLENTDPLLGVLTANGGYTPTHALLSGSPAIDAGTDSGCPAKDQRGVSRPQGSHCDIGAFEYLESLTPPRADFDGDGMADPAKFYSSTGVVWWLKSSTSVWDSAWLGSDSFDYVRYSDFDGDGKTDPGKFSSTNGTVWYIKSSDGTWEGKFLGVDTYDYVGGNDFDGDGKSDPTKLLPNGAIWYPESSTGIWQGFWVGPEAFEYVGGSDFDGDGKSDPAKFIADPGVLWYWESSTSGWVGVYLGSDAYSYVSASDFDGDGMTDPAKFYESTGVVWWLKSTDGTWDAAWMGSGSFTFVGGNDFDGDGMTDPAKYDPSTGTLSWLKSSTSTWDSAYLGMDSYELIN